MEAVQVTHGDAISHPSYFLQSSFYPGGGMYYVSYQSGSAQLWETDLQGAFRQLTSGAGIHAFSPALHPRHENVLVFTRESALWSIHRLTLAERKIVELPGASIGEPSISADGEWVTAAFKSSGRVGLLVGRYDGHDWHIIDFPRTVIHPQFHPLEPEWIEFAGDPAPRMFRVRRDGTGMECLYEHDNDEFVVHETFLGQTGDLVYTVWPHRLCRMDWTTRETSVIAEFNAWHISPNRAGTEILCDTNHPDRGIFRIDAKTGEPRFVCASGSSNQGSQWKCSRYAVKEDFAKAASQVQSGKVLSWMEAGTDTVYGPQWTHPHPSWSFDERRIAFASDKTGVTQVYVCEVK